MIAIVAAAFAFYMAAVTNLFYRLYRVGQR